MKDRLPPHALQSEKAVIGCCLFDPKTCIPEVALIAKDPMFFYDLQCQLAWETIAAMELSKVNVISLSKILREGTPDQQKVDQVFLNDCQDMATSTANLATWLEEVEEQKIARDILAVCTRTAAAIYGHAKPREVLEGFETNALGIRPAVRNAKSMKALLNEAIPLIQARAENWNLVTGLSYGLDDLDRKTDGMHPGEFVVIGAPTSCGKTAMALGIAMHNALAGVPAAFVSAEMLPVRLAIRALCSESRVNFKQIAERDVMNMLANIGKIGNSPIHVESISSQTIGQVRAVARRMFHQHGIKIFAAENIQLILGDGETREQRISNVSAGLKGIALELGIVVIGLSQLNEDAKLRESRAIGHDADTVIILENDGLWVPGEQPMIANVEKCRDGETGPIPLTLFKTFTRFEQPSKFADEDVPKNPHND